MTLKAIEIHNVKGLKHSCFDLNILPNRPSLIVAPNGFGKSSLTTAFHSLQKNKINIHDDDLHEGDDTNRPKLILTYQIDGSLSVTLEANDHSNTISDVFDCFVINSQVKAKGTKKNFGKFTSVSASMAIDPIVLINKIPTKTDFKYSIASQKSAFGVNGKVLPNITELLSNLKFVDRLADEFPLLDKILGKRIQSKIDSFIENLNQESGTKETIVSWIQNNKLTVLKSIDHLSDLSSIIGGFDSNLKSEAEHFLAAIQIAKSKWGQVCP